jgi:hypothetical protein
MNQCAVDKRHRCRAAAELIAADPRCAGVDVLQPATGDRERWVVEATITTDAVPPGVLSALAERRLSVRAVQPQGDHQRVVAVIDDD